MSENEGAPKTSSEEERPPWELLEAEPIVPRVRSHRRWWLPFFVAIVVVLALRLGYRIWWADGGPLKKTLAECTDNVLSGNPLSAIEACRQLTKKAPNWPTGWFYLSMAYSETGKHDQAISTATNALWLLSPQHPEIWCILARAYCLAGREGDAVQALLDGAKHHAALDCRGFLTPEDVPLLAREAEIGVCETAECTP